MNDDIVKALQRIAYALEELLELAREESDTRVGGTAEMWSPSDLTPYGEDDE